MVSLAQISVLLVARHLFLLPSLPVSLFPTARLSIQRDTRFILIQLEIEKEDRKFLRVSIYFVVFSLPYLYTHVGV